MKPRIKSEFEAHKPKIIKTYIEWTIGAEVDTEPIASPRICLEATLKAMVCKHFEIINFTKYDYTSTCDGILQKQMNNKNTKQCFFPTWDGTFGIKLCVALLKCKDLLPQEYYEGVNNIQTCGNLHIHNLRKIENIKIKKISQHLFEIVDFFFKNDDKPEPDWKIERVYPIVSKAAATFVGEVVKELKFQNVVSSKISNEKIDEARTIQNFIKLLGISDSSRYAHIEELYVPPKEYDDIKDTLEKERIVFISGPPEFGKTFTAVKLLWEWYKQGYHVEWKKGDDETQREKVRSSLGGNIESLNAKTIYYYEDPFGLIKYENKSGELELKISRITRAIQNTSDSYVIITSREDVFDEFKKRSFSKNRLELFEKKLSIISPSYDMQASEQMILKYGNYKQCSWFNDSVLKEFVIEKIRKENVLPSPLSIFNYSIISKEDISKEQLQISIKKSSEEVGEQFAHELMEMNEDEKLFFTILFLVRDIGSTPLLSDHFFDDENKISSKANTYITIVNKFKDKKIELDNFKPSDKGRGFIKIQLIHPSFYHAWEFLIQQQVFRDIASAVICENNRKNRFHLYIKNYSILNDGAKRKLLEFLDSPEDAKNIAEEIISYYESSPKELKDILKRAVQIATAKGDFGDYLMESVVRNIKIFPKEVRKLIGDFGGDGCAYEIIRNWDKIEDDDRKLLFTIINNGKAQSRTLKIIIKKYHSLPEEIHKEILTIFQNLKIQISTCMNIIQELYKYDRIKDISVRFEDIFLNNCYPYTSPDPHRQTEEDFFAIEILLRSNYIPEDAKQSIINIERINNWLINSLLFLLDNQEFQYGSDIIDRFEYVLEVKKYLNYEQIKIIEEKLEEIK